jgi:hypothetical protein
MVARVTLAEVDTVRTSVARMLDRFEAAVLPLLHGQQGYEGCTVLTTPEGKAIVITYWTDEAAADASLAAGVWDTNVGQFVTLLRTPAGREAYDVSFVELPASVAP